MARKKRSGRQIRSAKNRRGGGRAPQDTEWVGGQLTMPTYIDEGTPYQIDGIYAP